METGAAFEIDLSVAQRNLSFIIVIKNILIELWGGGEEVLLFLFFHLFFLHGKFLELPTNGTTHFSFPTQVTKLLVLYIFSIACARWGHQMSKPEVSTPNERSNKMQYPLVLH